MPSQLPLKSSREYPSSFHHKYEESHSSEKENMPMRIEEEDWLSLIEKARMFEEENENLKKQVDTLSDNLEGSVSRAQLCQIEAQCQIRETEAVRRLQIISNRLLQFGPSFASNRMGCSFSSLREALSLAPSEVGSVLSSARDQEVKSLEEVVNELEKNIGIAEEAILNRDKMKEELQGRMVKQVRESMRDELLRERDQHSRREEEVVRRVRQEESVKYTFETERLREEVQKLKLEAEGGQYESQMFILRCENDRLNQKLEKQESRHLEELKQIARELEETRRALRTLEEQSKQQIKTIEINGIQKEEQQAKWSLELEKRTELEKEVVNMKLKLSRQESQKLELASQLKKEKSHSEDTKLDLERLKAEIERMKTQTDKLKKSNELRAIERKQEEEKMEDALNQAVQEAMKRAEQQFEEKVELVKQMGKEKVEEMRKVHDRILSETELALEKERKQRAVEVEKARLEGRQQEEKARLEVAKELQALKQSEMKYVEGNQRLLANKFKSEIERLKTLIEQLASRHLGSAACSKEFFTSDLHEVKDGLTHLEKKLHLQFDSEEEVKEKQLQNLSPSVSLQNPLLSIKSNQTIMIPSSPATNSTQNIATQSEDDSNWDERLCLRCGGNSYHKSCKFHPYRAHQGVSSLLYTDVWNQCREHCNQDKEPCYSQNTHFYGEKIPYKRRSQRTAFSLDNISEQAEYCGLNCSRGTETGQKPRGREMRSQRASVEQRQSLDKAQIRQAMRSVRERMQQLKKN